MCTESIADFFAKPRIEYFREIAASFQTQSCYFVYTIEKMPERFHGYAGNPFSAAKNIFSRQRDFPQSCYFVYTIEKMPEHFHGYVENPFSAAKNIFFRQRDFPRSCYFVYTIEKMPERFHDYVGNPFSAAKKRNRNASSNTSASVQ